MNRPRSFAATCFAAPLVFLAVAVTASAGEPNDLRDVRVGMAVSELPEAGYVNFSCASKPDQKLAGWKHWKECAVGEDGMHAIHFEYDRATSREGTMVAGHPAILTVLVDDAGQVSGLQIQTDPKARLYIHKKAFLLGMQAKSRYGAEGWKCSEGQSNANEQPVGGVYLNEHCTKTVSGRNISVDRKLFRRPDQDTRSFVDETRIRILKAKS
jgi:hypothetical protein